MTDMGSHKKLACLLLHRHTDNFQVQDDPSIDSSLIED